jgi:hypothetical protein
VLPHFLHTVSTLAQSRLWKLLTYTERASFSAELRRALVNGRSEKLQLALGIQHLGGLANC